LVDAIPARPDAEKKSIRAAEQARADIAEGRRVWRELQPRLKPEKLIFLDETCAKTNMTRLYGRAPRGKRLIGAAPFGHWNTTTFIAGLRHDRIVAPMVLNQAMNGRAFKAWVEQSLAPTLARGDLVVADNLGSHKVSGVREAIEARGAQLLFLPPYSPDLNPIEQVFAKLKALLRKAAPRTRETLWQTIGTSLDRFTPLECRNYIRHCGYGRPG
jgi:transposase